VILSSAILLYNGVGSGEGLETPSLLVG